MAYIVGGGRIGVPHMTKRYELGHSVAYRILSQGQSSPLRRQLPTAPESHEPGSGRGRQYIITFFVPESVHPDIFYRTTFKGVATLIFKRRQPPSFSSPPFPSSVFPPLLSPPPLPASGSGGVL